MKKPVFLVLWCLIGTALFAQKRECATMQNLAAMQAKDPSLVAKMAAIERNTAQKVARAGKVIDGDIITIPVVVHVLWKTEQQNISEAQIMSQMEVLNEDFRLKNTDRTNDWSDREADIQIEFCMATVDPNGNPTNGIIRKQTNRDQWGSSNDIKFNSRGGITAWDTSQYLNMWVGNIGVNSSGQTLLGYAQFPGGDPSTDGVVMSPQFFGSAAKGDDFFLSNSFDLGRTTTHEIGHFLNLRHIWGDTGCGGDDFVADTPLAGRANTGCPSPSTNSCGSGANDERDMYENYMDYSDDACMNLFTSGQKARMRAILLGNGVRARLANSTKCSGGGTPNPDPNPTDDQVPSIPGTLSVTGQTETSVDLAWGESTDNVGVVGYEVFSGNTKLVGVVETQTRITELTAGETYLFTVRAIDAAGNTSGFSNSVEVIISESNDICEGVEPYNPAIFYDVGDLVTFQGFLYEREFFRWTNLGACGSNRVSERVISEAVSPPLNLIAEVKMFPNPVVNGKLNISVDGSRTGVYYSVTNLLGQVVQNGSINSRVEVLDLSTMKTGIYIVKVVFNDQIVSKAIMIE